MYYGPLSYYSLGQVYPRRRLREPFPFGIRRHLLGPELLGLVPVKGPVRAFAGSTYLSGPRVGKSLSGSIVR